ncbi:hypothetical protein J6590_018965 [Homalodisca vitripennis]|nr:hypothetical protein J6590_018965 [Homalodisca vitripennis]
MTQTPEETFLPMKWHFSGWHFKAFLTSLPLTSTINYIHRLVNWHSSLTGHISKEASSIADFSASLHEPVVYFRGSLVTSRRCLVKTRRTTTWRGSQPHPINAGLWRPLVSRQSQVDNGLHVFGLPIIS